MWSLDKKKLHINVRELKTVHLALQHFVTVTSNKTVTVHSDNAAALAYIKNLSLDEEWPRIFSPGHRTIAPES